MPRPPGWPENRERMVVVIGLAAKNAILIVEFAVDGRAKGKTLLHAVIEAGKLRLRPILAISRMR
jgi:multidrug efflux pump